ncbi:MAG: sensor histidine kinase [Steroidobacteraceae bacterium]
MNDVERPNPPQKSQLIYWIFQVTGWGLYSLSRFFGGVSVMNLPWVHFGVQLLLVDALGFVFSHVLRNYVRRHQWRALSIRKRILPIIAAAIVCGIPLGIVTQFTDVALLQDPNEFLEGISSPLRFQLALPAAFALEIVNWSVLFLIWQTIYFTAIAVREYRSAQLRQSELARALQLAELRLLKSQLNPHFLFNALNTVRSLIADHPTRAQSAVTHLANTLRYTLSSRQDELVTLSQELAIVADYLELESMRFEDRLRIEKHVPADTAGVRIPVMLLQTLVENAIKHGIAKLPAGGVLRISAAVKDDMLNLEVENPRPKAQAHVAHESVGLRNARDRLRLLFGARASLDLDLSQATVATARLCIPVQP